MHTFEIKEDLEKSLQKLARKDKKLYESVMKKILQIAYEPELGKPLRNVLKGKRRVHVGHFVLIYSVDDNEKKVTFLAFEHHDKAYQ